MYACHLGRGLSPIFGAYGNMLLEGGGGGVWGTKGSMGDAQIEIALNLSSMITSECSRVKSLKHPEPFCCSLQMSQGSSAGPPVHLQQSWPCLVRNIHRWCMLTGGLACLLLLVTYSGYVMGSDVA